MVLRQESEVLVKVEEAHVHQDLQVFLIVPVVVDLAKLLRVVHLLQVNLHGCIQGLFWLGNVHDWFWLLLWLFFWFLLWLVLWLLFWLFLWLLLWLLLRLFLWLNLWLLLRLFLWLNLWLLIVSTFLVEL